MVKLILFLIGAMATVSIKASNSWVSSLNKYYDAVAIATRVQKQPEVNIDAVKQKWADWANAAVEKERDEFIKHFCLNKDCLNDPELADEVKAMINSEIAKKLESYKALDNTSIKDKERIQAIVSEVFKDTICKVVHCEDLSMYETCVMYDCDKCSYVCMNVKECVKNLEQTEDVLRHEYSHVEHKDMFYRTLLELAFAKYGLKENDLEAKDKYHEFCRAYETRADVQAAINSRCHGRCFIDYFKEDLDGDVALETHPKDSERIALLEKIKQELDSAIK